MKTDDQMIIIGEKYLYNTYLHSNVSIMIINHHFLFLPDKEMIAHSKFFDVSFKNVSLDFRVFNYHKKKNFEKQRPLNSSLINIVKFTKNLPRYLKIFVIIRKSYHCCFKSKYHLENLRFHFFCIYLVMMFDYILSLQFSSPLPIVSFRSKHCLNYD